MDLSIIIPTLNEENYIQETLDRLYEMVSGTYEIEVILIDAGSRDHTVQLVSSRVNQVLVDESLCGAKYKSLNKGAELATGTVLLFLDADCFLPNHFDVDIMIAIEQTQVVGGAFGFQTQSNQLIYKALTFVNGIRYKLDQRYYGDQGLFCRRSAFIEVGGYPSQPIMEAAFMCRELEKAGELVLIKSKVLSSTRRFREGGFLKVMAKDSWIWIQFVLGFEISKYGKAYWAENSNRESVNDK